MDASTPSTAQLLDRLSVPANRLDSLSFCAATLDGLDRFLSDLPITHTPEVLNRLYKAVPEVASLQGSPTRRLEMLLRLQPVIFRHVDLLTERLSVTDKTARQLSLALALLKNLALGYKSVVVSMLSDGTESQQQLAVVIQLSISALSHMLTTSWLCFVNPPANLWREIHALFLLARTQRVENLSPFSAQAPDNLSLAPRNAYLRILLAAAADPARLSPRDLKLLLSFLDSHAQHAQLLYEGESALFTIDPNRDRGPILSTRLCAFSPTFIGLDSTRLAAHIAHHLPPSGVDLPPRLLAQLHRYWSHEIMRREEHRQERRQVSAVFGLSRLHRLLTRTANVDDFVSRSQVAALHAGRSLLATENTGPQRIWQDIRENEPTSGINWLHLSHSNPDDLITYTPQRKRQPDDSLSVIPATQVNISDHGACIELGTAPDNLSPGELVAIQATDSEDWRMGLVRWTRTTASFSRLAGLEFLDIDAIPCAAALIRDNQRASAFFPAFLTRPGHGEEHLGEKGLGEENLIVPSLPFTQGSRVVVIESQERSGVRLIRVIEATHQLTMFRIEREQQP